MHSTLVPPIRRGGKDIKPSNNAMDIDSIRARRARLEEMIGLMRLPPLTRSSSLTGSPFSKGSESPASNAPRPSYLQRRRSSLETPKNAPLTPSFYRKLPDSIAPLTPMTCRSFVQPLPNIGRSRDIESRQLTPRRDVDSIPEEKRPSTSKSRMSVGSTLANEEDDIADSRQSRESIEKIVHGMGSNSKEKCLESTMEARKLLSLETNPPIDAFFTAGVLTPLMPLLQTENNDALLFEAVWTMTNLAAGTTVHTSAVVNAGAVPILINLLKHKNTNVKEQAAWALGNISGDGSYFRNLMIQGGAVEPLIESLEIEGSEAKAKLSLVRVVSWVMSNLFRHKGITISAQERKKCLDTLKILVGHEDSQVSIDALWSLSYFSSINDENLEEVVACGFVPLLINHMQSESRAKVVPALRAIGNIAAGNDVQTDTVLDNQALPILRKLLGNDRKNIVKEAAWTISNITAGTRSQIQRVIDAEILPMIIEISQKWSIDVQSEAIWAISNLTDNGSDDQMVALIEGGAVTALTKVLSLQQTNIMSVSLIALNNLLKVPEKKEVVKQLIMEEGGMDKIENLVQHPDPSISGKAEEIIGCLRGEDQEETSSDTDGD